MKKMKKFLCLLLAMVILIPNIAIFSNAVDVEQAEVSEPLLIEVTTDKSSYTAYGIAGITVKVTNTSDQAINNISAEAVFEQLAPVGKDNETFKEVESLQPNESFEFSYKATVNSSNVKINFFAKIFLWFTRLFNGGYTATSHDIEADIENITEIKFGKYTVQNVVRVGYDEKQINNSFEFVSFETDTFNVNVGETKTITFSATVFSENILPDGTIKLYEKNDGFIGFLQDNGENCDIEINDGIFTGSFSFSPTERETKTFYAEAYGIKSNVVRVGFTQYINDQENNEIETFNSDIAQIKSKYSLSNENAISNDMVLQNAKSAYNEIINYLNNSGIVKSYNTTTFCIMVELKSGISIAIDLNDLFPSENTERLSRAGFSTNFLTKSQSTSKAQNLKQGVACLRALGGVNSSSFKNAANTIVASNDNYIIYPDLYKEQVTIDVLKNLADYRIILFESHGGNDPEHGYCIGIYEKVTAEKNKELERNGDFNVTVTPMENGNGYIVYESFFDKYYSSGDFDNSLIYLGTCHGSDDNVNINNILLRKGVQTVLSYSNIVASNYDAMMIETIAKNLATDSTINTAVDKAKGKHGYYSPVASDELWNQFVSWVSGEEYKKAELFIHGNKNFKLSDGYISGTVKNNNVSISNAKIDITSNDSIKHSVTSNKDGYFSCQLSAGTYTITITKHGYKTKVINDIKVNDEFTCSLGYISLYKEDDTTIASVHGTVKDEKTGNAISGVRVEFIDNSTDNFDTVATATTGADGSFSVELPYGSYSMSFNHDNYEYYGESIEVDTEIVALTEPVLLTPKNSSGGDDDSGETIDPNRTVIDSGNCGADGDNVKWVLYDDGELVISGKGEMDDYYYNITMGHFTTPWYSNESCVKTVKINKGITYIGHNAFSDFTNLTSITIPNSVTSIGCSAFEDCASLTSVIIPNSVTRIESGAFYGCTSLRSITIPNRITSIDKYMFEDCTSLTSVIIPNGVTRIESDAFRGCTSLTSVTIPDSVTSIGFEAFQNCVCLTSVYIKDITSWCNINFSSSTSNPLSYSKNLYLNGELVTDITISDSITSIGDYAFYNCTSLTNITIPDSVTSIGGGAFYDCTSLTNITIPDSVTSIGSHAFYGCTSLTSITIPGSVTSIDKYAFYDCTNLSSVHITDITSWCSIVFSHPSSNPLSCAKNLYLNGELVTDITIPTNATRISDYAFYYCTSLTSITIPDSVTNIGDYAFCCCGSLTSITIPDSVTSIGDSAFASCGSLTSITIPDGVTSIGDRAFYYCTSLTSITIPDSVTIIGDYAFYICESLTYITIPHSVTGIGDSAFWGCTSLTSVTVPNSVMTISNSAFRRCSNITDLHIGNGVTTIGNSAFADCEKLTDVYYAGTQSQWNNISIADFNTELTNATIHYNSKI